MTPLALAAEIRGATSVTVIDRATHAPLWCVAVERSRAVGVRTSEVLTISVVPSEVRGAVSHIVAAVGAADSIAGVGGSAEGWDELVLVDDRHVFLVRALTASAEDGLIVCLTLDKQDASLAAAQREFERLVAAELAGPPPEALAGMPLDTPPADAGPANADPANADPATTDPLDTPPAAADSATTDSATAGSGDTDAAAAGAVGGDPAATDPAAGPAVDPSGLPRRPVRPDRPTSPDFTYSWTSEADLARIVARLRSLAASVEKSILLDP